MSSDLEWVLLEESEVDPSKQLEKIPGPREIPGEFFLENFFFTKTDPQINKNN